MMASCAHRLDGYAAACAGQHRRALHEGDPRRMFGYQRRRLGAAREDNEGSGRGGDYGPGRGSKQRQGFSSYVTWIVFLSKKSRKLLATC
jgi:hypothetical protein